MYKGNLLFIEKRCDQTADTPLLTWVPVKVRISYFASVSRNTSGSYWEYQPKQDSVLYQYSLGQADLAVMVQTDQMPVTEIIGPLTRCKTSGNHLINALCVLSLIFGQFVPCNSITNPTPDPKITPDQSAKDMVDRKIPGLLPVCMVCRDISVLNMLPILWVIMPKYGNQKCHFPTILLRQTQSYPSVLITIPNTKTHQSTVTLQNGYGGSLWERKKKTG